MAGTAGDEESRKRAGELGDAWQWGLETSRLMGERLLGLYSEVGASAWSRLGRDGGDDLRQARIDMERWVDSSVELFDRAFAIMQRLGDTRGAAPRSPEGVSVIGARGTSCTGELWVHNVADGQRSPPVVRCGGLASATGGRIAASRVTLQVDPQPLDGRTSRKVSVIVDIPEAVAPGIYHGQILSDASPDAAVPLRVDVRNGPAADDTPQRDG